MRGFTTAVVLLALVACSLASTSMALHQLLTEKARLTRSSLSGEDVVPILTQHGEGVTDGQETAVQGWVDQAAKTFGADQYASALFIQSKAEESFGGRWNVEIFGNDPSWGRATHISNDAWIVFFGYGDYDWDYIIWQPEC